jgi:hypothetical protein
MTDANGQLPMLKGTGINSRRCDLRSNSSSGTTMARPEPKPTAFETASIIAVAVFLLAWNAFERVTGTGPSSGSPPGTTYHAANQAGATVKPSDQPSVLDQ